MTTSTASAPRLHVPAADGVTTSAALHGSGLSRHAIAARCRPSGPWQRLHPGVVLLSGAPPSRRQRVRAALAYAGHRAVLSGADALLAHGMSPPEPAEVMVLVPASRRVACRTGLTVERTTRLPVPERRAGLPVAPLVRATVDAARHESDEERLRALLAAPVEAGRCTLAALRLELDRGNQRGSAAVRAMLPACREVVPVALGLARRLVRAAPLPPPRWQVPLHTPGGVLLGVADAWWPQAGLAWSLGWQQPPLPADEQATPALTAAGVTVLHTDPARVHTDPAAVVAELVTAFGYATTNPHR